MDAPLLAVSDLSLSFGALRALDGVNLVVRPGQIVGLIGPNGAGKSTLFNCISRFYDPDSGRIEFAGRSLLDLRADQVVSAGIMRTFQNVELIGGLSAVENVMIGKHRSIETGLLGSAFRLPASRRLEAEARREAEALLEQLGLTRWLRHGVADLPYGVRKTLEIARGLIARPRLLLLDEPSVTLHASERDELMETLRRVAREMGIAMLVVDHDMKFLMPLCDYLYAMDHGRTIAHGLPAEVRRDPEVIRAYLGDGDDSHD